MTPVSLPRIGKAAGLYMDRGWAVFPVNGKVPCTRHGVKDAGTEHRLARIWYARYPDRGVALATGYPSGVWALDLDGQDAVDRFVELQEEHGEAPKTVTSRTRNGWHLLFQMPGGRDVRNSASRVADGIDVRGTGGYIVLPPSPHPDGGRYRWMRGRSLDDLSLGTAPHWLVDLVTTDPTRHHDLPSDAFIPSREKPHRSNYVEAAIRDECDQLASTPEGSRNDRLNVAAFSLARFVASGDADRRSVVRDLARAATQAGLSEREIERTIESAFRAQGVA